MSLVVLDHLPFDVSLETLIVKMNAKDKPRACKDLRSEERRVG